MPLKCIFFLGNRNNVLHLLGFRIG